MTYPPYPQQPGGDGYQHPENDHGGYASHQYQQQQYSGMPGPGGTANGTGKLDLGGAIGFGFKAVFQQPVFWIGMTLLMGVLMALIWVIVAFVVPGPVYNPSNPTPTMSTALQQNLPPTLVGFLNVFALNAALKYINKGSVSVPEIFQNPQLGIAFAIQVIVGLVQLGFTLLATQSPVFIGVNLFVALAVFFLAPLFMFFLYYLLDGRGSVVECLSLGISDGRRNYGILLGYSIVIVLIAVAGMLTCGLGFIVIAPAMALANANAYRQISGGLVRSL